METLSTPGGATRARLPASLRVPALVAVWASVGVLFAGAAVVGWSRMWSLVRIPPMWPPFADLRTITGGLLTLQAGGDPFVDNPFDPWHRPLNYPVIWLTIFRSLGITDATVVWFGVLLVVLFLAGVSCLIWRARAVSELAALLGCTLSFASLFVMERGNTDMAAFALVMLGLLARPPVVVAAALGAAAMLKLFPSAAFVAALLRQGRG
ncbi:MAG TPA: hypothetical protein VMW48_12835, partial [Vicinamibacterales bacterium]|nr:hypothetical protein [Vicinamibacterales bacterium]